MATTFTTHHSHAETKTRNQPKPKKRGAIAGFLSDLFEDVRQTPLQAAQFAKHDMFREHIHAMTICYFALIVLLIGASIPLLGWAVQNLVAY